MFDDPKIPEQEAEWLELSEGQAMLNLQAKAVQEKATAIRGKLDLAAKKPNHPNSPRSPKTLADLGKQLTALQEQKQELTQEALALQSELDRIGSLPASSGTGTVAENAEQYRKQFIAEKIVEAEIANELAAREYDQVQGKNRWAHPSRAKTDSAYEEMTLAYKRGREADVTGEELRHARIFSGEELAGEIQVEMDRTSNPHPGVRAKGTLTSTFPIYEGPKILGEQPPKYKASEIEENAQRQKADLEMLKRTHEAHRSYGPSLSFGMQLLPFGETEAELAAEPEAEPSPDSHADKVKRSRKPRGGKRGR